MHVLAGFAVLAVLIGFAFGEKPARLFVGAMLALGAFAVLSIAFIAAVDIQRQTYVKPHSVIGMGPSR